MSDEKTNLLLSTMQKLYKRGATQNIQKVLVKTHAADIAVVLQLLPTSERAEIFAMESDLEKRADILSYLETDYQKELIKILDINEVVKIIDLMEKDDAADLLGEIEEEESQKILALMKDDDSEDMAELLSYPEDSAGGIMSTDFFALDQELSVEQAIKSIQQEENSEKILFYIYVKRDEEKLIGVLSLKQLLLSNKKSTLKDVMLTDVISAPLETQQIDVANIVEKYDFLSLPIVDDQNRLMGVVTVDDVIDVIREEAEEDLLSMAGAGLALEGSYLENIKNRLPWLGLSFITGVICFYVIYQTLHLRVSDGWLTYFYMLSFLPMHLSMGATLGSQSSAMAMSISRMGQIEIKKLFRYLRSEFLIGLTFTIIFSVACYAVFKPVILDSEILIKFSLSIFIHLIVVMTCGILIPFILKKISVEDNTLSVPFLTFFSDIFGVVILLLIFI